MTPVDTKPAVRPKLPSSATFLSAVASIELLAIAVWLGGLVALGAIAAPAVFGVVPMPSSADAMTLVFRRFDRVAVACAAIVLVGEALLIARGGSVRGFDIVRAAISVLAASLAIGQGAWISPTIDALHRSGAVRGFGETGMALERTHRLAELSGKTQLLLLAVGLTLVVVKVAQMGRSPNRS